MEGDGTLLPSVFTSEHGPFPAQNAHVEVESNPFP